MGSYDDEGKIERRRGTLPAQKLLFAGIVLLVLSVYLMGDFQMQYDQNNKELIGVVVKFKRTTTLRVRPDENEEQEEDGHDDVQVPEAEEVETETQVEQQEGELAAIQQEPDAVNVEQDSSTDTDTSTTIISDVETTTKRRGNMLYPGFGYDDPKLGDKSAYHFGTPFQSKQGRRFMSMVVTLPSFNQTKETVYAETRLGRFEKKWAEVWPGLHIKRQQSFVRQSSLKGYGLMTGFYTAMKEAMLAHDGEFDYVLFLEDDAYPFPNTTWPAHHPDDNDLEKRLSMLEKQDGCGIVLGGHHFGYNPSFLKSEEEKKCSITRGYKGFGSYAFIIEKKCLALVVVEFEKIIERTMNWRNPPDVMLWKTFKLYETRKKNSGGYISVPLLIDHISGFSSTWQEFRDRSDFEGIPEFWNHHTHQSTKFAT